MSKAFTKEDDGAGFTLEASPVRGRLAGPVTALGSRLARQRGASITAQLEATGAVGAGERSAEVLRGLVAERERMAVLASARPPPPPDDARVAAFGARVRVRSAAGLERVVFIASADEVGLVPHAATVTSPFARALLGARAGDAVEVDGPRGLEAFVVVGVEYPL